MPQVAKPEMRDAIVSAARDILARSGFSGMTLSGVAQEAGTSVGNLYKYFSGKDELFAAAIPEGLVRDTRLHVERRMKAVGSARDVHRLAAHHPYRVTTREFFEFAWTHRKALVFLLSRAEGTAYESFTSSLVERATALAVRYAKQTYPSFSITALRRRALGRIYTAFFLEIAATLEAEVSRFALSEAVDLLTSYHLAGLRAFYQTTAVKEV